MEAIVEGVVSRFDQTVEFRGDCVALIHGHDGERATDRWERQGTGSASSPRARRRSRARSRVGRCGCGPKAMPTSMSC